ncbi:hypothetical protein STCU_00487 [Strigomonas culicis]|uniref:Uncharacterized protein n=1 Tax=Strigomonas culicis TaxID=28005 RepID=S9WC33_9TRYP|nr:hypothetical protein STCU_00487 [Strigomonas culicis]|eukprot:EPY36626.1 hypothetical protein STCU_00487 [Strigomonas culicis]
MPRITEKAQEESSLFALVVEQGWIAFIILGIFMICLRLYNVKQRSEQRAMLREGIMAELGYKSNIKKKSE